MKPSETLIIPIETYTSLNNEFAKACKRIDELRKENENLKMILIRCKEYLPEWITPNDILAEIDKLEVK